MTQLRADIGRIERETRDAEEAALRRINVTRVGSATLATGSIKAFSGVAYRLGDQGSSRVLLAIQEGTTGACPLDFIGSERALDRPKPADYV